LNKIEFFNPQKRMRAELIKKSIDGSARIRTGVLANLNKVRQRDVC
jgi:hypothetical protein